MFELPQSDNQVPDGLSEARPLVLEGILASELETFLRAMFPRCAYRVIALRTPDEIVTKVSQGRR